VPNSLSLSASVSYISGSHLPFTPFLSPECFDLGSCSGLSILVVFTSKWQNIHRLLLLPLSLAITFYF
jgi:hypothetical protein